MFSYGRDRSVSNSWPQINLIRMCKWYCLFIYTTPWTDDWDRQWISFLCSLAFDMMWFRVGWENRDNFFLLCVSCCCQRSFHLLLFFIIESLLGYSFSGGLRKQNYWKLTCEDYRVDLFSQSGLNWNACFDDMRPTSKVPFPGSSLGYTINPENLSSTPINWPVNRPRPRKTFQRLLKFVIDRTESFLLRTCP